MSKRAVFSKFRIEKNDCILYWMLEDDAAGRNSRNSSSETNYIKVCDGEAIPQSKTICPKTKLSAVVIQGDNDKRYYRYSDYSMNEC